MNISRLSKFPEPSQIAPPNTLVLNKVWRAISDHGMIQPGDSVLVGVSGGPDSVALLYLLMLAAPRLDFRIGIAHVNHCLRGAESDEDERFVADLAEKIALPFYSIKKDVRGYQKRHKLSPEDAGRRIRYAFYEKIASEHGYSKVALGHHADDNAELILMNLIRGAGPLGLSGIPPVRQGWIIRPLIRLSRSDIRGFLDANHIPSVTDATNTDPAYFRNRVRHEVIPWLEAHYNPNLRDALNRMADIAGREHEWIEGEIAPVFETCVIREEKGCIALDAGRLRMFHPAVQRRLLRNAVARVKTDLRRINLGHIDALVRLLESPGGGRLDLPDRVRAEMAGKELAVFLAGTRAVPHLRDFPAFEYRVTGPGTVHIKDIQATMAFEEMDRDRVSHFHDTGRTAWFDRDTLEFPLIIRSPRPGDRFRPLGMAGSQKLKKFFNANKVPVHERRVCPVLISRDRIIWVAGYRSDETTRITSKTRSILRACLYESSSAPAGGKE